MATGDLKNNLRKLQFELRTIKYDRDVDFERYCISCIPVSQV